MHVLESRELNVPTTLPYDAILPSAWLQRPRRCVRAPDYLVASYRDSCSRVVRNKLPAVTDTAGTVRMQGFLGLGLSLGPNYDPVISVEAASILQLVRSSPGEASAPNPFPSRKLAHECFHAYDETTGWRGCFAEGKLWSALLLHSGEDVDTLKTPYAPAIVRGWYSPELLDDLLSIPRALEVAYTVRDAGFDGAPDLAFWHPTQSLRLVEVKSSTDHVKPTQAKMMSLLKTHDIDVSLCCTPSAAKRLAPIASGDTTDEDA
ncbi:VRR-NUC domain-containing protein [bacterium]|nr:VRR-NUC domain-containing protein [bacterium]